MRSNKQWKVQQLLRLAELCDAEQADKRRMYMDMAEDLLFGNVSDAEPTLTLEEMNHERYPSVSRYIEYCEDTNHEIEGSPVADEYERYLKLCSAENLRPEGKVLFSKAVKSIKGFKKGPSKVAHINGLRHRIFSY